MRLLMTRALAAASMTAALTVLPLAASVPQSAGTAAGKAGAIKACSLLPKAEVKKLAAPADQLFDRLPPEEEPLPGGGSACSYSGIHIQVNPFPPARFEEFRKRRGALWTPVPDVGDAAYFYDNNSSKSERYGELYARAGQHVVTIQLAVIPSSASADTVRPAAVALAQALLAKLR